MGQAKIKKRLLESLLAGPLPESGLFFLLRRNGISAVLAVRRGQGELAQAGLFCVDDWKEGLFQCLGRAYASAAEFQREFKASGSQFRPTSLEECRRRVAQGLRVRRQADAEEPKEFSRWASLLGELEGVLLPESLYLCPLCDSPLPHDVCQTILDCVGTATSCYMACENCVRHRRSGISAETAAISHHRTIEGFQRTTSFSLRLEEDESCLEMAPPGQTHHEAIRLSLERDNDPVLSAALALEWWMNRATDPNEAIKDEHVEQALKELLAYRRVQAPLAKDSAGEVTFVRGAAQEGLAAYADACKGRMDAFAMESCAISGIEKVLGSVRRRRSFLDRRSYIKFIAKHML